MIYPIYSVKDAINGYNTMSLGQNDADAMRGFAHACRETSSLMNSHPQHFTLMRIGELDTESGEIIPCQPKHICDATDFIFEKGKE